MNMRAAALACLGALFLASVCWSGWPRRPEFHGFSAKLELAMRQEVEPPKDQSPFAKPGLSRYPGKLELGGSQSEGCQLPRFTLPPAPHATELSLGAR